jgi:NADH:ubiquinone oxidoreductase subunit F (NADH-binding)
MSAQLTRLLAGTEGGARLDLAQHLAIHGALELPARKAVEPWVRTVLAEIERSGLAGRGGGGFPTSTKLASLPQGRRRNHLVINVMEGEPAAQKDSVLAAYAPHLILDGAEALALLIHAASITVAVARDNPGAASSLSAAMAERARRGRDAVPMSIETLPARYVGGEESGLVHWLDGGPAMPTFRPHKPARLVVRGRAAIVDNAETAASVALIARHGGAWFANAGRNGASGSSLVTISGAVAEQGVFEVALGSSLGEVVALAKPTRTVAGILLGGYGGTFVGPGALDAPYSKDGLRAHSASVGAGVIVVLDSASCGITETARITRWMANESAGQCGPCVFGLPAIAGDLEVIAAGRGDARTERQLRNRLKVISGRGACAHPDGVVRMVSSALDVFAGDLTAHVGGRRCTAASAATLLALPANGGALEWR